MKLTKSQLREIIKEEISKLTELTPKQEEKELIKVYKGIYEWLKTKKPTFKAGSRTFPIKNLEYDEYDGITFEIETVDNTTFQFSIDDMSVSSAKPVARIIIASNAKRGSIERRVSGSNVSGSGIWNYIEQLWKKGK